MPRLDLIGCFVVLAATFAKPTFAQKDACSPLTPQQVASIVGVPVISAKLAVGAVSQACTYRTAASGVTRTGFITVAVYKVPLPTPDAGLMIVPGDTLTPVAGIGDEAVMDGNTHELKFRVGDRWSVIETRGAPCAGDEIGASREVKDACEVKRNAMLMELAKSAAATR
jgi:hypothetical protein